MRKLPPATEKNTTPDSNSDTGDDTRVRPDLGSPPSTPRWVKVFGIIAIVLILLFVILHLTGGGFGNHSNHRSSGGLGGYTQPEGGH